MKKIFLAVGPLVAASATLWSAPASAASDTGLDLGLRLGYGIPMGKAASNAKPISDVVSGQIPIWLDAGYRFTPNIMAGLYFQYGFGLYKDCPSGASCSASDVRLGAQFQYRLQPGESVNPWVGIGVGYEWFSTTASAGGLEASSTGKGFEFANLQGGADFSVADGLGIGPFVSFSLGQFSSQEVQLPGAGTQSGDIEDKSIHEWLVFGVRGTYGL